MATTTTAIAPTGTDWQDELRRKFGSSITRSFILHGNVTDYVSAGGVVVGQTLRQYLSNAFKSRYDVVVFYNRAAGFWFPKSDHKRRFLEVTGLAAGAGAMNQAGSGPRGMAAAIGQSGPSLPDLDEMALKAVGANPVQALALLTKLLAFEDEAAAEKSGNEDDRYKFKAVIVVEYAETLVPTGSESGPAADDRTNFVALSEWGRDNIMGAPGSLDLHKHVVIMTTANQGALAEPLKRSGWETIEIALPTYEQRLTLINGLADPAGEDFVASLAESVTAQEVARLTTGLTFRGVEDIFMQAEYAHQPVSLALVKERKDELIAAEFNQVLSIVDSPFGFESLGGMTELKAFLRENVIEPMRNGQLKAVPQGLLLQGPPGTGKSKIAKALAREAGVTFVELQFSKIYNKYVGDSERNLDRALTAISSMTPCIFFIDELDQALQRGENGQGGDSGVSNRLFKRVMEFAADTTQRGRVLFVAATNRPDLLDAGLRREGRLDIKIPVLAPDRAERLSILMVLAGQAFQDAPEAILELSPATLESVPGLLGQYEALAASMEGYTGAAIEAVTTKAARLYHKSGGKLAVIEALEGAFDLVIAATGDAAWMTDLALEYCSDLELVPPAYRAQVRKLKARAASISSNRAGKDGASSQANDTTSQAKGGAEGRRRGRGRGDDKSDLFVSV